jgi:hypothetical protein
MKRRTLLAAAIGALFARAAPPPPGTVIGMDMAAPGAKASGILFRGELGTWSGIRIIEAFPPAETITIGQVAGLLRNRHRPTPPVAIIPAPVYTDDTPPEWSGDQRRAAVAWLGGARVLHIPSDDGQTLFDALRSPR